MYSSRIVVIESWISLIVRPIAFRPEVELAAAIDSDSVLRLGLEDSSGWPGSCVRSDCGFADDPSVLGCSEDSEGWAGWSSESAFSLKDTINIILLGLLKNSLTVSLICHVNLMSMPCSREIKGSVHNFGKVYFLSENCSAHRGAFCQFSFRWIHYYGSNKSIGLEIGKSHLFAVVKVVLKVECQTWNSNLEWTLCIKC